MSAQAGRQLRAAAGEERRGRRRPARLGDGGQVLEQGMGERAAQEAVILGKRGGWQDGRLVVGMRVPIIVAAVCAVLERGGP